MGDFLPSVSLGTGRTAKLVAPGSSHTCALLDNETIKCWGSNSYGQLGLGVWGSGASVGDGAGEMGDNLPYVRATF
jgi:alpha-tubulin suppressor-like RCC1 family protein